MHLPLRHSVYIVPSVPHEIKSCLLSTLFGTIYTRYSGAVLHKPVIILAGEQRTGGLRPENITILSQVEELFTPETRELSLTDQ